jgi:poly(hydroxyalkanoate) depolymerase family esterase
MFESLQNLMFSATRLTQEGRLGEATQVLQQAFGGGSAPAEPAPSLDAGRTLGGEHRHASLTRHYRLFVPPSGHRRRLPLIVMLHGCMQDADDFAAGTAMNELARAQGFFVLYPEQSAEANPSRCWNWFKHNHQQRGRGEPAFIADLARTVVAEHGLDPCRVFIAGLSAGGAMAAITAQAYPELFAAVGVHSGLPIGAASDMGEAMAAMRDGAAPGSGLLTGPPVPTIVFHGDDDSTVHPRNGEQVLSAALGTSTPASVENGRAAQGRHFTRSTHHAKQGHAVAEHWLVHGAGHAWSGGQGSGSFTDPQGPDASAEMLRFFLAQPRRPARTPRFHSSPHDKAPP